MLPCERERHAHTFRAHTHPHPHPRPYPLSSARSTRQASMRLIAARTMAWHALWRCPSGAASGALSSEGNMRQRRPSKRFGRCAMHRIGASHHSANRRCARRGGQHVIALTRDAARVEMDGEWTLWLPPAAGQGFKKGAGTLSPFSPPPHPRNPHPLGIPPQLSRSTLRCSARRRKARTVALAAAAPSSRRRASSQLPAPPWRTSTAPPPQKA